MIANVSRLAHSTPAVALHKASPVTCYMVDITRHYIVHSVIHHYALCYVCAMCVLCLCCVCVCVCVCCVWAYAHDAEMGRQCLCLGSQGWPPSGCTAAVTTALTAAVAVVARLHQFTVTCYSTGPMTGQASGGQ